MAAGFCPKCLAFSQKNDGLGGCSASPTQLPGSYTPQRLAPIVWS